MGALTEFEEAAVLRSTERIFTGIQAYIATPTSYSVGEVTAETRFNHYFNFYVGIEDDLESGISYSRKYDQANGSWRTFAYSYKDQTNNFALAAAAGRHHLKLVLGSDRIAQYFLDGNLVASIPIPVTKGQVKMCRATCDTHRNKKYQVWYSPAMFELVAVRTEHGQKHPSDQRGWLSAAEASRHEWEKRWRPSTARLSRMTVLSWDLAGSQTYIKPLDRSRPNAECPPRGAAGPSA